MKWTDGQRHIFYAELEKLLRSGFGLDRGCRVLLKQEMAGGSKVFLEGMINGLGRGESVVESAEGVKGVELSELELSMIGAGERGGKLERAFSHLSQYFGMLHETRRRVRRAMIYPVLLLHAGVLLPSIPKVIMAQGQVSFFQIAIVPLLVMYMVVFAGFLVGRALMAKARAEPRTDRLLRRIPLVGKARESLALSRFCQVFHMHLLAAINMSESVRSAGLASQSGLVRSAAGEVSEKIVQGETLGESMMDEGAFPVSFTTSISTAEEAGVLDEELGRWTGLYGEEAVEAMDAAGVYYPKVFYVIVVVLVAWQILSVAFGYGRLLQGTMDEIGW
ncbi:MAG: type II secretion system F family protein [Verrucomicrobiota bacterium]